MDRGNEGFVAMAGERVAGARRRVTLNDFQDDRLVDEHMIAGLLGHSVSTIRKWRFNRTGPPWIKVGKKSVRYSIRGLREWLETCSQVAGQTAKE